MNFWCLLVVPLLWVVAGYSLAFKGTGGLIGSFDNAFEPPVAHRQRQCDRTAHHDLPRDLCVDYPGAHFWCRGRSNEVLLLGRCLFRSGHFSCTCQSPIGCSPPTDGCSHGVRSTSWWDLHPCQRRCGGARHGVVDWQAQGLALRGAPPHSMPLVMLGTGASVVRLVWVQVGSASAANGIAVQAFRQHLPLAGLRLLGSHGRWSSEFADGHFTNLGAGFRRGRRIGSHHAGMRLHGSDVSDRRRTHRRSHLQLRYFTEGQAWFR